MTSLNITNNSNRKSCLLMAFLLLVLIASHIDVYAQKRVQAPKANALQTNKKWTGTELKFLTDSDYPPFNYIDEDGALTGFNVDLARAICLELEVQCDVQAKEWSELIPSIQENQADAIIASLAIRENVVNKISFTNTYFKTPARFIAFSNTKLNRATPENFSRYNIGVIAGTAHEAYLKDFFTFSSIKSYKTADEMYLSLKRQDIELIFGDAVTLMFWLNGQNSEGCCKYIGGRFTEPKYFGEGIAIAVNKTNDSLRHALNEALDKVKKSGRYEELILRYFPLRF